MKFLILSCLLFSGFAMAEPCGLEGTIEERIKHCNLKKEEFVLVARTEKVAIFKDEKTGLIWGDRIFNDFNHFSSQKACGLDIPEREILKDFKWRLPSVREFEIAASHGMKDALPSMQYVFWTSTPVKVRYKGKRRRPPAQAYLWDGPEQRTDVGELKDAASVRCVAQGPSKK